MAHCFGDIVNFTGAEGEEASASASSQPVICGIFLLQEGPRALLVVEHGTAHSFEVNIEKRSVA